MASRARRTAVFPDPGVTVEREHRAVRAAMPLRPSKDPAPVRFVPALHPRRVHPDQGQQQHDVAAALATPPAHHGQAVTPAREQRQTAQEDGKAATHQVHGHDAGRLSSGPLVRGTHHGPLGIVEEGYVDGAGHVALCELAGGAHICDDEGPVDRLFGG